MEAGGGIINGSFDSVVGTNTLKKLSSEKIELQKSEISEDNERDDLNSSMHKKHCSTSSKWLMMARYPDKKLHTVQKSRCCFGILFTVADVSKADVTSYPGLRFSEIK